MAKPVSRRGGFFGVINNPQSYLNIVYLLMAFPLGTFYFVFLVTGLSLGIGLSITLLGIPILGLVLGGSWALCRFERGLAIALLREEIPAAPAQPQPKGLWSRAKTLLKDRLTWTGLLYLLLKFPLGIATFTLAVALIAATLALLGAPIVYLFADIDFGVWYVDTLPEAFACTLVGVGLLFISLHLMNGFAVLSGRLARVSLGK